MSLSKELLGVFEDLVGAEDEVVSITGSIKQLRHDHAVTVAGLEELLEQAMGDLDAARSEAVKVAAEFVHGMEAEL